MIRYIFLLFCAVITFTINGLVVNLLQAILYVTLKHINRKLFYKCNAFLSYTVIALYVFFVDWYSNSEIYLYMNKNDFKKYFGKENMYLISNHRTEVDWILLASLADKANLLAYTKCYIKDYFKYVPGLGMVMYFTDCIQLSRNYKKDKIMIERVVNEYVKYPSNIAIVLTPEGTRFTKEKHELSMVYAKEHGLPIMKYHLTPRTKGFAMSLPLMRSKLNSVYSVTWSYDPEVPKVSDLLFGRKIKAHCYVKRIPIEEIPEDEKDISTFMCDMFAEKDKLFDNFHTTGDFRTALEDQTVERIKLPKKYSILLNSIFWYIVSGGLVLFASIHLLLNGAVSVLVICLTLYVLLLLVCYKLLTYATMKSSSSYGLNNNNFCPKVK